VTCWLFSVHLCESCFPMFPSCHAAVKELAVDEQGVIFPRFFTPYCELGGAACLSVSKCPSWRSLEMFRDHRDHLWMVCGNIMKYEISIWLSRFIVIYPSSWGMFTHVCQNLLVSHLATTHPQPWSVMSGFRRRIRRSIPFNIASHRARLAGLAVIDPASIQQWVLHPIEHIWRCWKFKDSKIVRCGTFVVMFSTPLKLEGIVRYLSTVGDMRAVISSYSSKIWTWSWMLKVIVTNHRKLSNKPSNKPSIWGWASPPFFVTLGTGYWFLDIFSGLTIVYHNSHDHGIPWPFASITNEISAVQKYSHLPWI